jgi:hypothetical protein
MLPGSMVKRHSQASSARQVTLRPAPDTMCYLTALLPVVQGVAAYPALVKEADRVRATGDPDGRGRGQVMADTLVERLTGQEFAADVSVEVELVVPWDVLLGESQKPAHLVGFGPLPAKPGVWCATPRPRSGCAGSSPSPGPGGSSPWTPVARSSRVSYAIWSSSVTSSAALRGVAPRSATPTTPFPGANRARPTRTTPRASAKPATTSRMRQAGASPRPPRSDATWSPSRRPQVSATPARRRGRPRPDQLPHVYTGLSGSS